MLYMLFGCLVFTSLSFGSLDENHAFRPHTGFHWTLFHFPVLICLIYSQIGNKNDTSWLKSCKVCPVRKSSHCKNISPRGSGGCVDLPLVPFSIYFHEIVVSVQLSYTDTRYKIGQQQDKKGKAARENYSPESKIIYMEASVGYFQHT